MFKLSKNDIVVMYQKVALDMVCLHIVSNGNIDHKIAKEATELADNIRRGNTSVVVNGWKLEYPALVQ